MKSIFVILMLFVANTLFVNAQLVISDDKNILTAVAIPQEDTRSILWYTLPLLILVIGAGIFLGSKKEDNQADDYTSIDDDSK